MLLLFSTLSLSSFTQFSSSLLHYRFTIDSTSLFFSFLLLLFSFLFYFLYSLRARPCSPRTLPGPPHLFFFGTILDLLPRIEDWLDYIEENFVRYGLTYEESRPGMKGPVVHTADPAVCEYILKGNFNNYEKGEVFRSIFDDLLGDGIINVDGEKWREQRKTASLLFTSKQLKNYMSEVFVKHGDQVMKRLGEVKEGEYIDMCKLFHSFTFDSICDIAFSLHDVSDSEKQKFCSAFDRCSPLAQKRRANPLWNVEKKLSLFLPSLFRRETELRRSIATIDAFVYKIVKNRRAEHKERAKMKGENAEGEERADLISLFLSRSAEGDEFTDRYLRDVILTFIMAGRDSTAQALSWAVYCLNNNPDKEKKAQKEIDEWLKEKAESEGIDRFNPPPSLFKQSYRLIYPLAVIYETLRLYPSVPRNPKTSVHSDILPPSHPIPAGTMVMYCPYSMGRREELWEDATKFKPERFIEEREIEGEREGEEEEGGERRKERKIKEESPFKYTAFQAGPRTCLGKQVALTEAVTMLSMIMSKYQLRLKQGVEVTYQVALTLMLKNPLLMSVHKRELVE